MTLNTKCIFSLLQSFVSDMVQANGRKLEKIEKFLETLECKIDSLLMASDPGSEIFTPNRKKTDLVSILS